MAMTNCKECGTEISTTAKACPKCGAVVPKKRIWPWIVGVPVGLFAVLMVWGTIIGNSPEGQAKAKARDTIAFCWQEQKRKSFDAGTQRFVAGACEQMEADFVRRFGHTP
jgi:hypothetical protein